MAFIVMRESCALWALVFGTGNGFGGAVRMLFCLVVYKGQNGSDFMLFVRRIDWFCLLFGLGYVRFFYGSDFMLFLRRIDWFCLLFFGLR